MPEWSSGICECHTHPCTFISTLIFPWATIGINARQMQKRYPDTLPEPCDTPECTPVCASFIYGLTLAAGVGMSALACSHSQYIAGSNVILCFTAGTHAAFRYTLRQQKDITGDWCDNMLGDCVCALFCYSCAMTQEYKTLGDYNAVHTTPPKPDTMFTDVSLHS